MTLYNFKNVNGKRKIIWNKNKRIDVKEYLKKYNLKFVDSENQKHSYFIMRKIRNFNLGLRLVNHYDLNKVYKEWWGVKVIFVMKNEK